MKKYYLIFFIFFSIEFSILSQKYYQIPDTLASWDIEYKDLSVSNLTNFVRYESLGDTIVNQKSYIKIYSTIKTSYYIQFYNPNVPIPHIDSTISFYNLIRNANDGKVFVNNGSYEYLLYDFSLNVGDSVFMNGNYFLKVLNIDSIQILGNYRKRLKVNPSPIGDFGQATYWIEGIGGIGGLFSNTCCGEFYSSWLDCFKVHDSVYFSPGNCNVIWTNINIEKDNQEIKIYPLPIVDKSFVIIPMTISPKTINIYDIYLRLILQSTITNKNEYIIYRNKLLPGIYFVEIIDIKGNRMIKKIIVK